MLSFKSYIAEAWANGISSSSRDPSVVKKDKYTSPKHFKSNAVHVGNHNGLEIHSSDSGSGMTHFTWSPHDKMIHHVVHAAEKTKHGDKTRLKYLSAHSREHSPVRMGDVYKHLVKHHNIEFVGTGHSPGAQKMWSKFHDDNEVSVHSLDPSTGKTTKLNKSDTHYAPKGTTDPKEKLIGKQHLLLTKS